MPPAGAQISDRIEPGTQVLNLDQKSNWGTFLGVREDDTPPLSHTGQD